MEPLAAAHQVLDSILGHLGFSATIEEEQSEDGLNLQVSTTENEQLVGRHGERLDDLQYLVNRILQLKMQDPPRVRIDCDHFREKQEASLADMARHLAGKAKASGKPMKTRPLNSYHRRIVHNALVDDSEVETSSPKGESRMKRIVIRPT